MKISIAAVSVPTGEEVLRLTARPKRVKLGDRSLAEHTEAADDDAGWTWRALTEGGGVLKLRRTDDRDVTITL